MLTFMNLSRIQLHIYFVIARSNNFRCSVWWARWLWHGIEFFGASGRNKSENICRYRTLLKIPRSRSPHLHSKCWKTFTNTFCDPQELSRWRKLSSSGEQQPYKQARMREYLLSFRVETLQSRIEQHPTQLGTHSRCGRWCLFIFSSLALSQSILNGEKRNTRIISIHILEFLEYREFFVRILSGIKCKKKIALKKFVWKRSKKLWASVFGSF